MFSSDGYRVYFDPYTDRHYVKDFEKKYKGSWVTTQKALKGQFRNVDMLVDSGRTNPPIHRTADNSQWIIKHEFVIAGLKESKKTSGRRVIAHVNNADRIVTVLLVYCKDDADKKSGETAWWERTIKNEHKDLLKDFSF